MIINNQHYYIDMENVIRYLQEAFGFSARLERLSGEQLKKLPMFLEHAYDLYLLELNGYSLVLAGIRKRANHDPLQLKKQAELISGYLDGMPVVFALRDYTLPVRRRLIDEQVNFIAPGEQLYLPGLLMDFRENIKKFREYSGPLTPAAQLLLLYHIQVKSLENFPFKEIAGLMDYSANTVTLVAKELKGKDLCGITGTKEKFFHFREDKKGLWQKAQSLMQSPVHKVYTIEASDIGKFPVTHDNALAYYTDLAGSREHSLAVSKSDYKYWMKEDAKHTGVMGNEVRLEVWKYDPRILAKDGYVDPLSLYLCLREDKDERVQGELPKLIEQGIW